MFEEQVAELKEELQHFQNEKEKIRRIVGQIGGNDSQGRERIITVIFITLLLLLLIFDVTRYVLSINLPLPPLFSIEVGILLVSIKIIWMIHKQTKVERFQFWILNSIEFRLGQISKRLSEIEKRK
ncbi:MAG TPA: hypothetical protein PK821_07560 [Victivallales bacterium]|nr:hypothetical protein [Victivallales bacterium]